MKKIAVIGNPVSHSLSPKLHGFWIDEYNLDAKYEAVKIIDSELADFINKIRTGEYEGCNVTVPHKENVMQYLDEIEISAKKIGAVNTVYVKNDKIIGKNTDSYGFIENIKNTVKNYEIRNKNILILGAGGAARAVISGFLDENVAKIYLTNRTFSKAESLSKEMGENIIPVLWDKKEDFLNKTDILVNTTVLGMSGQDELNIDLENLPKDSLVYDIVYKPLMTKLLSQAKDRGNPIIDGLGMLLFQAVGGFEKWFGVKPDVSEELRKFIYGQIC